MANNEFSIRSNLAQKFVVKHIGSTMTSQGVSYGGIYLLGLPWDSFVAQGSEYSTAVRASGRITRKGF